MKAEIMALPHGIALQFQCHVMKSSFTALARFGEVREFIARWSNLDEPSRSFITLKLSFFFLEMSENLVFVGWAQRTKDFNSELFHQRLRLRQFFNHNFHIRILIFNFNFHPRSHIFLLHRLGEPKHRKSRGGIKHSSWQQRIGTANDVKWSTAVDVRDQQLSIHGRRCPQACRTSCQHVRSKSDGEGELHPILHGFLHQTDFTSELMAEVTLMDD